MVGEGQGKGEWGAGAAHEPLLPAVCKNIPLAKAKARFIVMMQPERVRTPCQWATS